MRGTTSSRPGARRRLRPRTGRSSSGRPRPAPAACSTSTARAARRTSTSISTTTSRRSATTAARASRASPTSTGSRTAPSVKAGQQIAYNGDSGDAEGIYHLHFEVHPKDGADVDPVPVPERRRRGCSSRCPTAPTQVGHARAQGRAASPPVPGCSSSRSRRCASGPAAPGRPIPARSVELAVPEDALLDQSVAAQIVAPTRRLLSSRTVTPLLVFTRPAKADLRRDDWARPARSPSIASGSADVRRHTECRGRHRPVFPGQDTATAERRNVDDLRRRRPGREDGRDAGRPELVRVVVGDRAADDHEHVVCLAARSPSTIRGTSVMCAPERIEMPTASASSWIAVSTICSGV